MFLLARRVILFLHVLCAPITASQTPEKTYEKLIPCILDNISATAKNYNASSFKPPADAQEHYAEVMAATQKLRKLPPHHWSGYEGPWIENHYIEKFVDKPLSYFSGLIPLFIQFVDIHVNDFLHRHKNHPTYDDIYHVLDKVLRHDVLYLAVSQDDEGIRHLQQKFPNIFTISAGGYGHVPIPLVKGEIPAVPVKKPFQWDIGFYGSTGPSKHREIILDILKNNASRYNLTSRFGGGPDWVEAMAKTKFNLSPRGFGRSSYRGAEIVQIGRIPVYLYNDWPWIPYDGSMKGYRAMGFVAHTNELTDLMKRLASVSDADVDRLLTNVRNAREDYTYTGVLKQIDLFLNDPLGPGGGNLRCSHVPDTIIRRRNLASSFMSDENDFDALVRK